MIDPSNQVGTVTKVDGTTISYNYAGYGLSSSASALSPQISALPDGTHTGTVVIDESNQIGTTLRVFKDLRVQYNYAGYTLVSRRTSPETTTTRSDGAKTGTVVIDKNDQIGTIKHIFADGRVNYIYAGYSLTAKDVVAEVITGANGIQKNTIVIDASNQIGTTLHAFADGRVNYKYAGYSLTSKNVVPEVAIGVNGIQKGIIIIDASNQIGTTLHAFADGRINYNYAGYSLTAKNVVPEVATGANGIHKGIVVIDESNQIGTTLHAFADNRVNYNYAGYSLISSKVSPEISELPGNLKKGIVVIDSANQVSTISRVFMDSRVQYNYMGYSLVAPSSQISPEVADHPDYAKGVEYASPDHGVGTVARFFLNRKVQFSEIDGYTVVTTTLSASVPAVGNYAAGGIVTDPSGKKATIESVFANGTIKYSFDYTAPGATAPAKQYRSAKIFGFEQEHRSNDQQEWIGAIQQRIQYPSSDPADEFHLMGAVRLAILTADYPALQQELNTQLQANPNWVSDQTIRAKVAQEIVKPLAN